MRQALAQREATSEHGLWGQPLPKFDYRGLSRGWIPRELADAVRLLRERPSLKAGGRRILVTLAGRSKGSHGVLYWSTRDNPRRS